MPELTKRASTWKKGGTPSAPLREEIRRAIRNFKLMGSIPKGFADPIRKILYVDVSLGFIWTELARASSLARKINLKPRSLVSISHCTIDEVWIKVAKTSQEWNFGLLAVSPKSLFIGFFDYVERRGRISIGTALLVYKQAGFNPQVLITDSLPIYKVVVSYFKTCLHQLCTTHARGKMARIIKDLISSRQRKTSSF